MDINQNTWNQLENDVGEEIMPMIIEQFIKELKDRSEKLTAAIDVNDVSAIAEEAHTVKSAARTVGFDTVADCAAETEDAGRTGQSEQAIQLAAQLAQYCLSASLVLSDKVSNSA